MHSEGEICCLMGVQVKVASHHFFCMAQRSGCNRQFGFPYKFPNYGPPKRVCIILKHVLANKRTVIYKHWIFLICWRKQNHLHSISISHNPTVSKHSKSYLALCLLEYIVINGGFQSQITECISKKYSLCLKIEASTYTTYSMAQESLNCILKETNPISTNTVFQYILKSNSLKDCNNDYLTGKVMTLM